MKQFCARLLALTTAPFKRSKQSKRSRSQKHGSRNHLRFEQLEMRELLSANVDHISVPDRIAHYVDGNFSNGEYSTQQKEVLALGYLDVTAPGYGATGNNNSDDDRLAIQNAIDDAYSHRLATYIPSGTYEIGNSLGLVSMDQSIAGRSPQRTRR